MERWDIALFYLINHARLSFLDALLPFFTGKYAFLIFFVAFFVATLRWVMQEGRGWAIGSLRLNHKKILASAFTFFFLIFGYGLSDLTCSKVLKPLFGRERPFATLERLYYYTTEGSFIFLDKPLAKKTLSFPSCHATNAAFLTVYIYFLWEKTVVFTLPTAFLVGISRIYLGHHFPADVLGGFFFGGIVGGITGAFVKRILVRYGRAL